VTYHQNSNGCTAYTQSMSENVCSNSKDSFKRCQQLCLCFLWCPLNWWNDDANLSWPTWATLCRCTSGMASIETGNCDIHRWLKYSRHHVMPKAIPMFCGLPTAVSGNWWHELITADIAATFYSNYSSVFAIHNAFTRSHFNAWCKVSRYSIEKNAASMRSRKINTEIQQ